MTNWWYMEKSLRPDRVSIHDLQAYGTVYQFIIKGYGYTDK